MDNRPNATHSSLSTFVVRCVCFCSHSKTKCEPDCIETERSLTTQNLLPYFRGSHWNDRFTCLQADHAYIGQQRATAEDRDHRLDWRLVLLGAGASTIRGRTSITRRNLFIETPRFLADFTGEGRWTRGAKARIAAGAGTPRVGRERGGAVRC